MTKRQPTREESAYLERVKNLPCSCCGDPGPCDAHHPRKGQGISQRAGHFTVISLCKDCHQGPKGIHGDRTMMRIFKVDEMDMIDKTVAGVIRGILGAQK